MIEVRPARFDEWHAVGELTVSAYVADGILTDDHWYADELRDAATRGREAELLVALDAGRLVGTITLAAAGTPWAEVAGPGEHEIRMLAVAPEGRGRGVAEELVLASMRRARAAGAHSLVLTTIEAMSAAQRLYRRLGMVRVPERDWQVEAGAALVYTADLLPPPGAAVERATWLPLRTIDVGPWRLGLSHGFTRRGNSAVLVGEPEHALGALDEVQARYREQGRPVVLRVPTARAAEPIAPGLSAELDRRGFRTVSTTRVLARTVRAADDVAPVLPAQVAVSWPDVPDEDWLAGWLGTKTLTAGAVETEVARALLTGSPAAYLTARDDEGVVGVVRAAPAGGWLALSCLVVAPRARRQGLGTALTLAALAGASGAARVFLQVEVENTPARALYAGLGFVEVDEYTYREL